MAKIDKYEDLKCWQQARVLVNQVYELSSMPLLKREFALSDQLKRSSISVMSNIAEGFSRYHSREFVRFLDYSQSSSQEVKSLLYIIKDQNLADAEIIDEIQSNCDHCRAMTLSLIKYLNNRITTGDQVNEPDLSSYQSDDEF
jgi:four helix bundle protein